METSNENILGIDVGGANLKMASTDGVAQSVAFEMWNAYERLPDALQQITERWNGHPDQIAVTMTGELADCFANKQEGVRHIVRSVEQVAKIIGAKAIYYGFDGFASADDVDRSPLNFAAANWHAIAKFIVDSRGLQNGFVIDCGSTTTDLIPIVSQAIDSDKTDTERLADRSLVYSGVRRTPVFGLVKQIKYRGENCLVAREMFATTQDIYLLLDQIAQDDNCFSTADGTALTQANSVRRLARLVCADETEFELLDAVSVAKQITASQKQEFAAALDFQMSQRPTWVSDDLQLVVGGDGEFLIKAMLDEYFHDWKKVDFVSQLWGRDVSACLGAFAVAWLCQHEKQWAR